jgi:hypothetical protein
MDPNELLQGRSRETTIARDDQGRWFHDGEPLEHVNLVRSFEGWIERADDGRYCLKNDINWAYLTLEGPAYFVRSARVVGDELQLTLSGGIEETLDPTTLRQGADGALYCDVRNGTLVARFDRHAMAQLAAHIEEDAQGVYIALGTDKLRPRLVSDPLVTEGERR